MIVNGEPQSWHSGLMATWWAEFNLEAVEEVDYFKALIAAGGEPALDLGCGTGRVLVPLLEAGLDVDGCDMSLDMLALCRAKVVASGLHPNLYQQAMHALELPRSYRTIFICDSFGLGGYRWQDAEALRRCHRHLVPGGQLVFNHYLPYDDREVWSYWLPEQRQTLPRAWPDDASTQRWITMSGDGLEIVTRMVDLDPGAQRLTLEMRARQWREGTLVAEEFGTLQENLYFLREIQDLLVDAGFRQVTVTRAYSDDPPTADDTKLMFVARK